MTSQQQYDKAAELATGMAKVTTREQVKIVTWLPFQLLYVEMARRKEIPAMIELSEKEKLKYWNEAKEAQPNAKRYKQIWIMQSLYLWDLITVSTPAK